MFLKRMFITFLPKIRSFLFIFSFFDFSFAEHLYAAYDARLVNMIKPIVIEISNKKEENFTQSREIVATKLFELYKELKTFSDIGWDIYSTEEFEMKNNLSWFAGGIDKWCKASHSNARSRWEFWT